MAPSAVEKWFDGQPPQSQRAWLAAATPPRLRIPADLALTVPVHYREMWLRVTYLGFGDTTVSWFAAGPLAHLLIVRRPELVGSQHRPSVDGAPGHRNGSGPASSHPAPDGGAGPAGDWRMANKALEAVRSRLNRTAVGEVWKRLLDVGFINSSLQFAAVFTIGFIPFLVVVAAALGPNRSRDVLIRSGFSARAGHDVTMLFTHGRAAPASLSVLALVLAVLGGSAIAHMLQSWYAKIFQVEVHGWTATARRMEWVAGVFGYIALQIVVVRTIRPPGGQLGAAGAQFVLALGFWWWSLHCLLAGQIPWRRLFVAGLATAGCCTGLAFYIAYVASTSIVANDAKYGPIGVVMTLITAEIGLGVALQLGAAIGATAAHAHYTQPDR